ncbi:MAG: leucine-rich repeat domain-containing protein, partial [Ruminococcus sp.]|nr:leucine-rich repeat domain-containing protein [Ruminococcus sp.]
MKSVNKILSLVLCLTMVLSVFAIVPFAAGAAEAEVAETGASSGTTGDCTWTLDDNGVLTISGNGAMGDDEPHPWGTNISKVIIEEGVTSIGDYAFFNCTGLTSVTIPDSVTRISECAFADCTGLTNVTIGNSVTIIDDEAFTGCTGLTSIDIPDSVTSIGWSAFAGCTGLTSVTIGKSVTILLDYVFGFQFMDCPNLTSIKIAEDNPVYDSRDNCNAIIETETNS